MGGKGGVGACGWVRFGFGIHWLSSVMVGGTGVVGGRWLLGGGGGRFCG